MEGEDACRGQNKGLLGCPRPNPQSLRICGLSWQKGLCRCEFVTDLEMGRWAWMVGVGPASRDGP